MADLRGTAIDLRMLSYAFVVLEENGTPCTFALDDIYYDGGTVTGVADGDLADAGAPTLRPNAPSPFNAARHVLDQLRAAPAGVRGRDLRRGRAPGRTRYRRRRQERGALGWPRRDRRQRELQASTPT
ncbi:MAG: hypothetical protein R3D98_02195 [Candidatus Krumholzibacteriia bacterium]